MPDDECYKKVYATFLCFSDICILNYISSNECPFSKYNKLKILTLNHLSLYWQIRQRNWMQFCRTLTKKSRRRSRLESAACTSFNPFIKKELIKCIFFICHTFIFLANGRRNRNCCTGCRASNWLTFKRGLVLKVAKKWHDGFRNSNFVIKMVFF